jgi:alginate O-acetyltransferase complex protein AlgI
VTQQWAGLHLFAVAPHLNIILPVGISFYTFQTLSYTVDVYRRKLEPVRELPRFLLFISFFPQLVAGPIVRASDFLPQLAKRAIILPRNVQIGFTLFLVGLVKKAVFADGLAPFVEKVYGQPHLYSSVPIIIATVAYTVQIYCDFSGYTDMAIGSAAALGFWLPKNFAHPYFSANITEFWQRWHISLSTWLRDYLYIPLGGNRKGVARTYVNLMIVMLLGGLWHGAKWTFVLWGGYQGALLALHRLYLNFAAPAGEENALSRLRQTRLWRTMSVGVTLYLVLIGWIFFRAENFGDLQYLLHKFVIFDGFHRAYGIYLREALFTMVLIGGFAALHFTSFRLGGLANHLVKANQFAWSCGVTAGLFAVMILTPSRSPEFIYFQF